MKELTLGPGEILYKKGQYDDRIFYLNKGVLEVYAELVPYIKESTIAELKVKYNKIIFKKIEILNILNYI